MTDRPSTSRQAALLIVTIVATLGLLAGGWALQRASSRTPRSVVTASSPLAPRATGGGGIEGSLDAGPPSIAPAGSADTTIVLTGAGDIADCASDGAQRTSDLLLRQRGLIFTAGDNVEGDIATNPLTSCYAPSWGRVLDRTLFAALGEGDRAFGIDSELAYLGTRAGAPGVTWFSREVGAWHVIVLDSECSAVGGCDAASPEGTWLADDLRRSSAHCTLAIWHRPRFSSGEHGNDATVGPFWTLLSAARADLVVNGHDHDYERFAPQDAQGRVERPGGIREIVVGTGGAARGQFGPRAAPNSEFRLAGTWGVLRLTLHPANYDWEFLPVTGDVADSGSTPCH